MPFDMAGEQAQKDVGAHPRGEPVVDRPDVQIDGLQAAEGALDVGEALVGADQLSAVKTLSSTLVRMT